MALAKYRSMRSFKKTPEPAGKLAPARNRLEFVVQKHDASHLHYDFRLELDGVLKSWAVPKGPSLDPKVRRLAVAVEDHPYQYRTFEGIIPAGNYGAGEVIVWDNGTYHSAEYPEHSTRQLRAGLKKGHLDFVLEGHKLRGRFALIRQGDDDKNWLLIKKRDKFSTTADVTRQNKSVKSQRTVESLAGTTEPAKLSEFASSTPPEFIKPMLATLVDKPFSDPDWLFELKLDGYRAIGAKRQEKIQLYSRSGQDFRAKYAPIAEALEKLPAGTIVDGEIVVIDKEGKPHFNWLQNWQSQPAGDLRYFVFDLLWLQQKDVRHLPLSDRKELLKSLLQTLPAGTPLVFNDHVMERGEDLFAQIQKQALEGIVAKRAGSKYQAGERTGNWLKIKTSLRQEVVIGGFTEPKGSRKYLGSLLLGLYEKGQLKYVGHSGGGIPVKELQSLRARLEKLERTQSPFSERVKPNAPAHWVEPELLCEVTFSEWTPDGRMRQPKFRGLREDKPATQAVAEHPQAAAGPATIRLTNPDKLFWPKLGITKGDLAAYYRLVSERMLPYLVDHPQSLLRHPNGYDGKSFFQKDLPDPPAGIVTEPIFSDSTNGTVHYLICKDLNHLLYMVQLGCIEINPWHSRLGSLDNPQWVVMDLDPVDVPFSEVVQVALVVKQLCDEWGIPSFPKTSGKKGLHIYIPTGGGYNEEQIKQFAELMALQISQREPKLTSLERSPSKRKGKVYLDYLRNATGQTLAAPYSVRPTPQATVSMPLDWHEVIPQLQPTDFTIKNVAERLKQPDPWKDLLTGSIDLRRLIDKLAK
jgi:bifunctional non-homologous end joining protein LigD